RSDLGFTGARITDLDGDGLGELAGHNGRRWLFVEWDGSRYVPVDSLLNPTRPDPTGNVLGHQLSDAVAEVMDLDRDGRPEFITTDADGDTFGAEVGPGGRLRVAWKVESDRYGTRPRFTPGDFDGDGQLDLVVLTHSFDSPRLDRTYDPPRLYLRRLVAAGDDAVTVRDSFAIEVPVTRFISFSATDLDGDGRDELVAATAPDLYVFSLLDGSWTLRFHRADSGIAPPDGTRAPVLVVADFDSDGARDVLVPMASGRTVWFRGNAPGNALAAQLRLMEARTGGRTFLAWTAPGADSVTVYGVPYVQGARLRLAATRHDTLTVGPMPGGDMPVAYELLPWAGGRAGQIRFFGRSVPAVIALTSATVSTRAVRLCFSMPLQPPLPGSVTLAAPDDPMRRFTVTSLQLVDGDHCVLASADVALPERVRVDYGDLRGREGFALLPATIVAIRSSSQARLVLLRGEVLGPQQARLTFSAPLDPSAARDLAAYRVTPRGRVALVAFDPARPSEVVVSLAGTTAGANGLATGVVVDRMRGADGEVLDADGRSVSLAAAAVDLSAVYAFPNPVRPHEVAAGVMIGGLPPQADVTVLGLTGAFVRRLEERDADGGLRWDLRDAQGRDVPSGVYLVRVTSGGQAALTKIAVLR
ncbi:MAG TPA: T9SS type A sorting domain-containing protein, partial [Rhodothermales bacterium]|nr:T9SS type A sorting domain-containing protein [Rhodothermales bacterium]